MRRVAFAFSIGLILTGAVCRPTARFTEHPFASPVTGPEAVGIVPFDITGMHRGRRSDRCLVAPTVGA